MRFVRGIFVSCCHNNKVLVLYMITLNVLTYLFLFSIARFLLRTSQMIRILLILLAVHIAQELLAKAFLCVALSKVFMTCICYRLSLLDLSYIFLLGSVYITMYWWNQGWIKAGKHCCESQCSEQACICEFCLVTNWCLCSSVCFHKPVYFN